MILLSILAFLPFYALGAFPTGILIAKTYGIDIASTGSGNVGATNVARTIGRTAGILTLAGDILKGILAVVIAKLLFSHGEDASIAGLFAVCGHCFSIPGKFKGGKGVATALGVILALSPLVALICIVLFAGVFAVSRIVSISSVIATLSAPLCIFFLYPEKMWGFPVAAIALLIVYRHRENLTRLIEGREPTFSLGSK